MTKKLEARHIIYFLLVLSVAIPLIRPMGLPLTISKGVRDSYKTIEALPNGSTVVMIWDAVASVFSELGATGTAFLDHIFRKDMKVIIVTFQEGAVGSFPRALKSLKRTDLVYGEDYIDLAFVPGGEQGLAAFIADIHGTVPKDRYGNNVSNMPITKNVKSLRDVQLVLSMAGGQPGTEGAARQIYGKYQVPIISGCTAGMFSTAVGVLWNSGHVTGVVPGLKGGAEYEKLISRPAYGASSMDALSMLSLYIVGLLVVGNAIHLRDWVSKRKGAGQQ